MEKGEREMRLKSQSFLRVKDHSQRVESGFIETARSRNGEFADIEPPQPKAKQNSIPICVNLKMIPANRSTGNVVDLDGVANETI